MRAVLCQAYGPPEQLVVADVPAPIPGPGQVAIAVKACDVNFPDTLIIEGKYQFQPPMPFTPGSDIAGIVTAIGPEVTEFAPGDRVAAFVGVGGFAEVVVCDVTATVALPDQVDFAEGAAVLMTHGTSLHALRDRAHLRSDETILVLGAAGGVGLAAVQIAKLMGARVIAAAASDEKLAVCRAAGADATINYATEDLRDRLKTIVGNAGVDVVYDPVGGALTEQALRSMAWDGRYLVIGFAAGEIPRIPMNLVLLKGCAIVGVFLGGFMRRDPAGQSQHVRELLAWVAAGKLHPHISATYPLEQAGQALRMILDRGVAGKVILRPNA